MIDLRRRRFLRGGLVLGGLGLASGCGPVTMPWQPAGGMPTIPRIGYFGISTVVDGFEAFRGGLRDLGYVEGRTIAIEARWAESNEQFPDLAAELVDLPVDLIVTSGGQAVQAAMGATRTIPIVFASAGNPVAQGLVASLARPGGNVTGLSDLGVQLERKRLQLLRELVPGIARVVHVTDTAAAQGSGSLREAQEAAQSLGVELLTPEVRTAADLPAAFEAAARGHAEAVLVGGPQLTVTQSGRIVELSAAARLPLLAQIRAFPAAGGLASYGANRLAFYRRAAAYVDKILKGANPADLPVEQPTEFEFVINLRSARTLGLNVPPSLLLQASEVIR